MIHMLVMAQEHPILSMHAMHAACAAPVRGSVVLTQWSTAAKGDSGVPRGLKLSVSGSVTGRSSSLKATASCGVHHS